MIDKIINDFNTSVSNAISRYAKEEGVENGQIQIVFTLKEGEVCYEVVKNFDTSVKKVTFLELLNVRFDFLFKGQFVPPYIQKTIQYYAETLGFNENNISIINCFTNGKVSVLLYHKRDFIEVIDLLKLADTLQTI